MGEDEPKSERKEAVKEALKVCLSEVSGGGGSGEKFEN